MSGDRPCPACDRPARRWLRKDGYQLHRCAACGMAHVHPAPTVEQLAAEVYSSDVGYHAARATAAGEAPTNPFDRRLLDALTAATEGRRLLDVGCSAGEFVAAAQRAGFEAAGVELNDGAAAAAREAGLDVRTGTLESAAFPNAVFDVVVLGDLIEHVPDIRALVAECRRLLAPGGVLAVRTPNLACGWARVSLALRFVGIPPSAVTPPEHLSQLTPAALDALMAREGLARADGWFEPAPPLRYELTMTRLPRRLRRGKSPLTLLRLLWALLLYPPCYALERATRPLRGPEDFSQVALFRRG